MRKTLVMLSMTPFLSGCVVGAVANTAVAVATLPVKVVAAGVDAATTSQSEADEKRGRETVSYTHLTLPTTERV